MIVSQEAQPVYIAIDLKSYYASVECVARGQNPLTYNLLVADESRSDKTIVLAVSPSLKAIGVPSRPRLFEAKEATVPKVGNHPSCFSSRIDPNQVIHHKPAGQPVPAP